MKRSRKSSGGMGLLKQNKVTSNKYKDTDDENIPLFEEINLRFHEDEVCAKMFRTGKSNEFQNSPDLLLEISTPTLHKKLTPRQLARNVRENLVNRHNSSLRKKKGDSEDEEDVIWRPKSTSNTPMLDYAMQYDMYRASVQGAKDWDDQRKGITTVPKKRLFTDTNEKSGESENIAKNVINASNGEPLKGIVYNIINYYNTMLIFSKDSTLKKFCI